MYTSTLSTRPNLNTKQNYFTLTTLLFFAFCFAISSLSAQDIDVRGWTGMDSRFSSNNYVSITNGDNTPSLADGTVRTPFVPGFDKNWFFYIFNTSSTTLNISEVSLSGPDAAAFHYTGNQTISLSANGNRRIAFNIISTTIGVKTATVTIRSDDPDEDPFTFTIQTEGINGPVLEMKALSDHSGNYIDNEYFPFTLYSPTLISPNAFVGNGKHFANVKINNDSRCSYFTMENVGLDDLVFSGDPLVEIAGQSADDFWVARNLRSNTLAPGAKDTISICYDPSVLETDTANVKIPSNDVNYPDIDFEIVGTAVEDLMCQSIYRQPSDEHGFMFAAVHGNTIWAISQRFSHLGDDYQLHKSTDAGQTWTTTEPFESPYEPLGIKYEPSSNLLIIGSRDRLYISTDGGATFTQNTTVNPLDLGGRYGDFVSIDGNTIYAVSSTSPNKLVKSTDNGQNFTEMTGSPDGIARIWASGNDIYVTTRPTFELIQLHRSTDGGATFTSLAQIDLMVTGSHHSLKVEGNKVYIGAKDVDPGPEGGLYISEDGGSTFTNIRNPGGISDDINDIFVNGDTVMVVTEDNNNNLPGFAYSFDGGTTWKTAINGEPGLTLQTATTLNGKIIVAGMIGVYECSCQEIQLLGNNVEILDQWNKPSLTDHTDFGEVAAGGTVSRTFTLKSLFRDAVRLEGSPVVTIEGADGAQFSVTTQPADVFLEKDETTTFTIKFDAPANAAPKTFRAIAKLATTDITEDELTFNIQATIPAGPTVTINQGSSQADPTNSSPIVFDVVFSEAVTGFETGDVTLGGTAGATTATVTGSGTTYTVEVTGMTQSGTVTASIATGVAMSSVGQLNLASTSTDNEVTYDITPPTKLKSDRKIPLQAHTNAPSVTFQVVFSEVVQTITKEDFDAINVGLTGVSVTSVSTSSGDTVDVVVASGTGQGQIRLDFNRFRAGGAQDAAGNSLVGPFNIGQVYEIDRILPKVTAFARNTPTAQNTNADQLVFDITFDEAVNNVTADDFIITGTTATGVLAGSGAAYTLTISGGDLANLNGTVGLNIASGQDIVDARGNELDTSEPTIDETYIVDNTAPTKLKSDRKIPLQAHTNAPSVTFQVVFSEVVQTITKEDFDAINIGLTGVSVTSVSTSSGDTVDVVVATGTGTGQIRLDFNPFRAGGAQDAAGNSLVGPFNIGQVYEIDRILPEMTAFARNNPTAQNTNADQLVFDITFKENVTNVTADDFEITGTTATGVLAGSGATYTLTVSGGDLANLEGTVGLNLASGQDITDLAGNALPNVEPTTDETYTLDNTAPSILSFTRLRPMQQRTNADTVFYLITFSEPVTGVDPDDFAMAAAGRSTAITQLTPSTYELLVTDRADRPAWFFDVNRTISLGVTTAISDFNITDLSGNDCPRVNPSISETYIIDNLDPTITTLSPADNTTEQSRTTNLVMTFNENVMIGTGNITIFKASDNSVVETIDVTSNQVSINNNVVTIDPSVTLDINTEYYVQVAGTALKDLATNGFAGISNATDWSFTTVNFICPTLGTINAQAGTCAGNSFNISIDGLANMAMSTNFDQDFGIKFVAFPTATADPYTGGTTLGTITLADLTGASPNQTATLNNVGGALAIGDYVIYAILSTTHTDANCRPSKNVNFTVLANPNPTGLTAEAADICIGSSATVTLSGAANLVDGNYGLLFNVDGGTTGNISVNITNGAASFNAGSLAVGNHTINVTKLTNGNGCAVDLTGVIASLEVFDNSTVANAGADQMLCGSAVSLSGNTPAVGTGRWTFVSNPQGRGAILNPTSPNATLVYNQLEIDANTNEIKNQDFELQWTISNGPCTVSSDNVVINLRPSPEAGQGQSQVCGIEASLRALKPEGTTGQWTFISQSPANSGTIQNSTSTTAMVTGVFGGVYQLQWEVTSGQCAGLTDVVTISFGADEDLPGGLPDGVQDCVDLCLGGDDAVNSDGLGMPDDCDCNTNDMENEFVTINPTEWNDFVTQQIILNGGTPPDSVKRVVDFEFVSDAVIEPVSGSYPKIIFQAGNNIQLTPGFHAKPGSDFLAKLDYCRDPETGQTSNIVTEEEMEIANSRTIDLVNTPTNVMPPANLEIAPNPANWETAIHLALPTSGPVNLQLFNQNGQLVRELIQGDFKEQGDHYFRLNTSNFAPGLYLLRLQSDTEIITKKLMIQR